MTKDERKKKIWLIKKELQRRHNGPQATRTLPRQLAMTGYIEIAQRYVRIFCQSRELAPLNDDLTEYRTFEPEPEPEPAANPDHLERIAAALERIADAMERTSK